MASSSSSKRKREPPSSSKENKRKRVEEKPEEENSEEEDEGYGGSRFTREALAEKGLIVPDLTDFDLSVICDETTCMFMGKRRTGKSVGIHGTAHVVSEMIQHAIVISATEQVNGFYREWIPEQFIYTKYSPLILQAILSFQRKLAGLVEAGKLKKIPPVLVILDDLIADPKLRLDPTIAEMFTTGRHYGCCTMMTTQYVKGIAPRLRGNTDFLFIFRVVSDPQRKAIWEDFGGNVDRKVFEVLMDECTWDNGCLVIDMVTGESEPLKRLFKFRFPFPLEKFKMGTKLQWEESKKRKEKRIYEALRDNRNARFEALGRGSMVDTILANIKSSNASSFS
jgi:hypothetical protein